MHDRVVQNRRDDFFIFGNPRERDRRLTIELVASCCAKVR
jgi:hypothetical protein